MRIVYSNQSCKTKGMISKRIYFIMFFFMLSSCWDSWGDPAEGSDSPGHMSLPESSSTSGQPVQIWLQQTFKRWCFAFFIIEFLYKLYVSNMMLVVLQSLQRWLFLSFTRDCVRERNKGRSASSFAVSDTAVGLRSPCKQVLLVPHTGEEVTLLVLFLCLDLHFQWLLVRRCYFVISIVSNVLYIAFLPRIM